MAKQPVSIVERHIEKGILGLCAVVLVAAIVVYLISTPSKIELGGQLVGPGSIDAGIRDQGQRLREKLRSAKPDEVEVVNYVPMFREAAEPLAYAKLGPDMHSPVPFGPRIPDIGEAPPSVGEIKLAKVIAPMKPMVTTGRSTLIRWPAATFGDSPPTHEFPGAFQFDVNWVTIAARFDQQQQISVCKSAGYDSGRRNPYIVGVDLQRREKRHDGSYADWADVDAYMPLELRDLPEVEIGKGLTGETVASEDTQIRVSQFFDLLREVQADIFRPMFPEKQYGDDWLYPKFEGVDIPALDRELCPDPSSCDPREYPVQTDLAPAEEEPKNPREIVRKTLDEVDRLLEQHQWEEARRMAEAAEKMQGATTAQENEAREKIAQARQGVLDDLRRPGRGRADKKQDAGPERKSRYQIVWAHDAAAERFGGSASGKTYQYRMRVRLYNRFCAVPSDLGDAEDSKRVYVVGDWSEPTDDVYIPLDTQFFLTSGNTISRSGAKTTIFKWYEGVWVKHSFPLEMNRPIGGAARETVRLLAGGQPDKPLVRFDAGGKVVDIDYDYMFRPKRRRGRSGFTIESPMPTVALVYVDGDGELRQRILEDDRKSSEYKAFKEKVADLTRPRR
ncbi:MAG: hypothetical protein V3W34_10410 [Phycisphaerae bacterium]